MPTTYRDGSSRSRRASIAEEEGRVPWSRLRAAKRHGLTKRQAVALNLNNDEWHHTSKYANPTEYFDPRYIDAVLDGITTDEARALADARLDGAHPEVLWQLGTTRAVGRLIDFRQNWIIGLQLEGQATDPEQLAMQDDLVNDLVEMRAMDAQAASRADYLAQLHPGGPYHVPGWDEMNGDERWEARYNHLGELVELHERMVKASPTDALLLETDNPQERVERAQALKTIENAQSPWGPVVFGLDLNLKYKGLLPDIAADLQLNLTGQDRAELPAIQEAADQEALRLATPETEPASFLPVAAPRLDERTQIADLAAQIRQSRPAPAAEGCPPVVAPPMSVRL